MTTGKENSSKTKATAVKKRRGPKKKPHREYGKGRWTDEERILFLVGLRKYGKGKWKEIAKVLTTRNPVQIKSHGQKLYSKLKEGKDIFFELNEYERLTGTDLQPATDGTCPLPTASGDDKSQDAPSLVNSSSIDESEGILPFDSEANEENCPPPPATKSSPVPSLPKIPSFVPSRKDGPPLLQTHFGIPAGISFVNDSPPMPISKFATAGSTATSPAQNQRDVLAAMVLCKLGTIGNTTRTILAPTATRPSFSPNVTTATPMPTFSSGAGSAFDAFEPIPLQKMEQQDQDQELLAACFPALLQDDEDDSSNVVTPTNIAEV